MPHGDSNTLRETRGIRKKRRAALQKAVQIWTIPAAPTPGWRESENAGMR